MTRGLVARTAAGLALAVAVAGCSAPPGPSPEEVTAWMDQQDDAAVDGLLGSATGRVAPDDPRPAGASTGDITLSFEVAADLDGVRLSCLGDGALDFDVHVTSESGGGATRTEVRTFPDVTCGAEAREEAIGATGVVSVGVTGSGADRAGAWHAEVLGDVPTA